MKKSCPICGKPARTTKSIYCSVSHAKEAEDTYRYAMNAEKYRQKALELEATNLALEEDNIARRLVVETGKRELFLEELRNE